MSGSGNPHPVLSLTKNHVKITQNKTMKQKCYPVRLYLRAQETPKEGPAKKFLV
jgi:hypothetical protein